MCMCLLYVRLWVLVRAVCVWVCVCSVLYACGCVLRVARSMCVAWVFVSCVWTCSCSVFCVCDCNCCVVVEVVCVSGCLRCAHHVRCVDCVVVLV